MLRRGLPLFALTVAISCEGISALQARQYGSASSNATSPVFHHLSYHATIVVGDYLYIDGGEVTTWDGQHGDSQTTVTQNSTFSIDLTSPWTNESVSMNSIAKGDAPIVNTGALWLANDGNTFFSYDGGQGFYSSADSPASNELWQFTPSGALGSWSLVPIPPSSNFTTLIRIAGGTYASGNGLGFALGGHVNEWTVAGVEKTFDVSGMVVYNSSSQQWYNVSSTGYSYEVGILKGVGIFVPSFGPAGLMFAFGGIAGGTYATFDYAYMYEPFSQQWKLQQTSGNIPAGVLSPCVVGLGSGSGTYEIFLYGGSGDSFEASLEAAAVYVLSLPSFHWHRRNLNSRNARSGHSCNVIGNRQMIVVGGNISDERQPDGLADIWSKGINIFDLSEMHWQKSYDPDAEPYVMPNAVKKYTDQNPYPKEFSDPTVEGWFTQKDQSSSSSSNDTLSSGSKGSNVGAIAGGTVGGVIGLALVAGLIFFLMKRRRRPRGPEHKYERRNQAEHVEADGIPVSELGVKQAPQEVAGVPKSELAAKEHSAIELPGNQRDR